MAINERVITGTTAEAGNGGAGSGNQEEGLILHLDANDVDSYDGDGSVWYDITNHEYKPTINVSEHFNTVLYSGTSSSVTIDAGFAPDLVWLKRRDNGDANHTLVDTVRGANSRIYSNTTDSAATNGSFSFNSDGTFDTNNVASQSKASSKHVAWCFKAGGAPTATNTATSGAMTANSVSIDGTLESAYTPTDATIYPKKISANTNLGFSTVLFTGTGNSNNKVPHGLGVPPELIIFKNIDEARGWTVGSTPSGWNNYLVLNNSTAAADFPYFDDFTPNSNVFEIYNGQGNTGNDAGSDFIAYCFASKRGVSKVGSYEGTGAAGNKVYTGFEPAFVMVKASNYVENWIIYDNKRSTDDPRNEILLPASNSVELSSTNYNIDFDSDGFTINSTQNFVNRNGINYIYLAFAKNTNAGSLTPSTDGTEIETDLIFDPTQVHYSSTNYALEQDNTIWKGNASKSGGTHEGEVYFNNYFKSGDTGKYYFEVKLLEGTHFGVAFTDPTKYNPRSATDTGNAQDDAYFYGLYNNNLINSNGTNVNVNSSFASISNGDTISVAIDVATRKIWFGEVSGGTITWYGSGNPSSGTNEASVLPSGWNIYQPLVADTAYSGSSARYGWWQLNRTASATTLPTGFSYMTGAIKNADLELHLDASTYTSGSTWTDSSGNGNDGTITGATHNDELGDWFDFDGSNDIIKNSSLATAFRSQTTLSIEAWFKTSAGTARLTIASFSATGDATTDLWLGFYASTNTLAFRNTNDTANVFDCRNIGGSNLRDGNWHHVVFTADSGGTHIYVDGDEITGYSFNYGSASTNIVMPTDLNQFSIGGNTDSGGDQWFMNGQIGQVRVYSSALSHTQIRQNFNFTKNDYPNGYNGTISGATWNSGGYFDFDGNDYVQTSFNKNLLTFSFSIWAKFDNVNTTVYPSTLISKNSYFASSHTDFPFYVAQQESVIKIVGSIGNDYTSDYFLSSSSVSANTWYFITAVVDFGNTIKLYINGNEEDSVNYTVALSENDRSITLGRASLERSGGTGNSGLDGKISKFKMHNKVLTQAEITALYNEGE